MENRVVLDRVLGTGHRFFRIGGLSGAFKRTIGQKRPLKVEKVSQATVLLRRLIEIVLFPVTSVTSGLPNLGRGLFICPRKGSV